MIDLKGLAKEHHFKTSWDESATILDQSEADRMWLVQIPGRRGHVFIQAADTLGAWVRTRYDSSDRLGRLLCLPGARLLARGDNEASVAFPPEHLLTVATILDLKRRRVLSDAERQRRTDILRSKGLIGRKSGHFDPQDASDGAGWTVDTSRIERES